MVCLRSERRWEPLKEKLPKQIHQVDKDATYTKEAILGVDSLGETEKRSLHQKLSEIELAGEGTTHTTSSDQLEENLVPTG